MSNLPSTAANLTRNWTSFYTWRLPPDRRDSRRAEIESDLWEHQYLASLQRVDATNTAMEILLRFALGMPADCLWRLETNRIVRAERRSAMVNTDSRLMKALNVAALVVVALVPIIGASIAMNGWRHDTDVAWMMWGVIPVLASVALFVGLRRVRDQPGQGFALVVAACLVISAVWFWLFMFTIPLSAGLIALSYHRAKKAGWRSAKIQLA